MMFTPERKINGRGSPYLLTRIISVVGMSLIIFSTALCSGEVELESMKDMSLITLHPGGMAFHSNLGPDEPVLQAGSVVHVKHDATGTGNGTSWDNAFKKISDALAAASAFDEIWVSEGAYNEGFFLKSGVSLYGGFNGTETERTARDPDAHVTIIDGTGYNHVVVAAGITSVVIDGFVLRGGSATLPNPDDRGGGILCIDASIQISNSKITDNVASTAGGGIYIEGVGSVVVRNDVIANNDASDTMGGMGGGVAVVTASPDITRSVIVGNEAQNYGGGVYVQGGNTGFYNNLIAGNRADSLGGGIYLQPLRSAHPDIVNNTIAYNRGYTGTEYGSGIYFGLNAQPLIKNNIIAGNDRGGIVEAVQSTLASVKYNDLFNNNGNYVHLDSVYNTALSINSLIGKEENIVVDPLYKNSVVGTSTALSTLVLTGGSYAPGEHKGKLLNPNTAQDMFFYIEDNTDTALYVLGGDLTAVAVVGNIFSIYDFHLQNVPDGDPMNSPCIDAGDPSSNYLLEPEDNGDRINQGAFGGTKEAARTAVYIPSPPTISILPMPDIYIGELEDEPAMTLDVSFSNMTVPLFPGLELPSQLQTPDLNLFRFPDAFTLDNYIEFSDGSALEHLVQWSFREFESLQSASVPFTNTIDAAFEINGITQIENVSDIYNPGLVGKDLRAISDMASFRDIQASPHSLDPGPYTTDTATRWITFFASYNNGATTDSETILVMSIDESYDRLSRPLFPPYTPEDEWTWTDLALTSNLFKAATPYTENPVLPGAWVLGMESRDTSNLGDDVSPGSYVFGTWHSPPDIEYVPNKLLVSYWHMFCDQPTEELIPAFRFRYETPYHWTTGAMHIIQPSILFGQFPTAPGTDPNNPTIYKHVWYPPPYIMNEIYTNSAYQDNRGMGLAVDLWDKRPEQTGRLDIVQVEITTEDVPTNSEVLYQAPPFIANDWLGLTEGSGTTGFFEMDEYGVEFSKIGSPEFRRFFWVLEPSVYPLAQENTLYRAVFHVESTDDPLPILRIRIFTGFFDNGGGNVVNVSVGGGVRLLDGLSVPGITGQDIVAYLWVPKHIAGDHVGMSFDAYDVTGLTEGTYTVTSCKLERVY